MKKIIFLIIGFLSLFFAFWGAVLPLVPTTPFLLLAAWSFSRSSRRMHHWLMTNNLFGKYLSDYREKKGIPLKVKVFTLCFLWISTFFTLFFITDHIIARIILPLISLGVSIHIIRFKTL